MNFFHILQVWAQLITLKDLPCPILIIIYFKNFDFLIVINTGMPKGDVFII